MKLLLAWNSNFDFELAQTCPFGAYPVIRPHARFYSIQEIGHMLEKAGLRVEEAGSFHWSTPQRILKSFCVEEAIRSVLSLVVPGKGTHIMLKARKPAAGGTGPPGSGGANPWTRADERTG